MLHVKLPQLLNTLDSLRLTKAYLWVATQNPGNPNPYHNLFHTQSVTRVCLDAGQFAQLTREELSILGLAALFHDYDHSAGQRPDAENIARAVAGLRDFATAHALPEGHLAAAQCLIEATQYPYVRDLANESEAIIRDADMVQLAFDNWSIMVFEGLRTEFKHFMGEADLAAFCALEKKFLTQLAFHSEWGRHHEVALRATFQARLATVENGLPPC